MSSVLEEILEVEGELAGSRLDRGLAELYPEYSRSYFQFLIASGAIAIEGKEVKKRTLLNEGDRVKISFVKSPELSLEPQNIPLKILYEDDDIIAIDKPVGMVVHPAPGNPDQTLANALLYHCQSLPGDQKRPGIVHRLDKETSGVIVAAKTPLAHMRLSALFSERQIEKTYIAISLGRPPVNFIEAPIGRHPVHRKIMCVRQDGKPAQTSITTLGFKEGIALLKIAIHTGRTHQIRVHLKSINTPLLGDAVYGIVKWGVTRPLLHAYQLAFNHPITQKPLVLRSCLPPDIAEWAYKVASEIKFL